MSSLISWQEMTLSIFELPRQLVDVYSQRVHEYLEIVPSDLKRTHLATSKVLVFQIPRPLFYTARETTPPVPVYSHRL